MNEQVRARLYELGERVLAPLVLGGAVHPVRPFGAKLALSAERGFRMADEELESRIDVARVRQARRVAPIDYLGPPTPGEWSMVAALNDLLQASNHELSGVMTRGRHQALLESLLELAKVLSPPRTIAEVLSRHATFARLFDLVRKDVRVSWWTGSASFRGREANRRLLSWPELRRVHSEEKRVGLHAMADDLPRVPKHAFEEGILALLRHTPLTDLATAARKAPEFAWSAPAVALVSTDVGRTLARRVIVRAAREEAIAALRRATERIAPDSQPHAVASAFCAWIEV